MACHLTVLPLVRTLCNNSSLCNNGFLKVGSVEKKKHSAILSVEHRNRKEVLKNVHTVLFHKIVVFMRNRLTFKTLFTKKLT